jgi:hypothetical protein
MSNDLSVRAKAVIKHITYATLSTVSTFWEEFEISLTTLPSMLPCT